MGQSKVGLKFSVGWIIPIILVFFIGGLLQYFGILSQTESNWLALVLFGQVFLVRAAWTHMRIEVLLIAFAVVIVLSHLQHGTPATNTITYLYYIFCAIIAAVAGRVYALRFSQSMCAGKLFKGLKVFLAIELGVVILQKFFTAEFVQNSRAPIGYIDAIFGTFFLQSDASLAAVCELVIILTFLLGSKMSDRIILCGSAVAIVFLGNSTAAKAVCVLLFVPLIAYQLYRGLSANRYGFNVMLAFAIASSTLAMYNPLLNFLAEFATQASTDYYHRQSWETAARFSPLGQMLAEGVSLFGQGALTYYNPMTKAWLYNAGFSTIYSLYVDFGLVGLSIYCLYQVVLISRFTRNYMEFVIFASVLTSFITLNFALTDIAFVFAFNGALYLNYLRGGEPRSDAASALYRKPLRHAVNRTTE